MGRTIFKEYGRIRPPVRRRIKLPLLFSTILLDSHKRTMAEFTLKGFKSARLKMPPNLSFA
jgi:hypothetical protein